MSGASHSDIITFLMGNDDMKSEDIVQNFSQYSHQYEKAVLAAGYPGPTEIAVTLAKLFPINRNEVYILDVAAGTGLCADTVHSQGFVNIDAMEPSNKMLDEARKKGIYSQYFVDGLGENTLDIANDTYDVVTMAALSTVILKRLPLNAFEELIRIVKPGGYIINCTVHSLFPVDGDAAAAPFRENMKTLESEGKWKQVEFRRFSHVDLGEDGAVSVHKVLE